MTEQPSGGGTDNPVAKLQPLDFKPVPDHGDLARYEALMADQNAPGSPAVLVTVTIASSVQRQSGKDIQTLLGGMKAAFEILHEPPPDNGGSGDEEPSGTGTQPPMEELFDSDEKVLIELSLAKYGVAGPVGVAVTVQKTTTSDAGAAAGSNPVDGTAIERFQPNNLGAGLDDLWRVRPHQSITASVTVNGGDGTISPPATFVEARPKSYQFKAREIDVHAGRNSINYSMSANFWLADHAV